VNKPSLGREDRVPGANATPAITPSRSSSGGANGPWSLASLLPGLCRRLVLAICGTCLALIAVVVQVPAAAQGASPRPQDIETYLYAYPKRALTELAPMVAGAGALPGVERRYLHALTAQSMVALGKTAEAVQLAEQLEREADSRDDSLLRATARLARANAESLAGDSATANALAKEARALLKGDTDPYLAYWAAITIGVTARGRGDLEESLGSLQEALSSAESVNNDYRRSTAHYQLSQLYLALKQPQSALDASQQAFRFAERAASAYGMVKARMVESAALELLQDPVRELAAMEEALAIARKSKSKSAESLALINLADIRLRRRDFGDALELSRQSLALAKEFDDVGAMATSKANMGFALLGLGRTAEGRRLAEDALADYERRGATADIASLLGEYSQYLEKAGDYKAALALQHRERKLNEQIAMTAHQHTLLELQEKYESDKNRREIELLNRQNALNSAELENRALRERIWWLLAAVFAVSFIVVAVLYHKLRVTNGLLATKNRDLSVRSSRDPLTALYNRRYFQDYMRDERNRPERRRRGDGENPLHALLLIDIDLFKQTNDQYGHAAGDAVLIVVARRLRDALRETDMIVRWGGEEFLVFVPATSSDKLDEIATRIMRTIASEPVAHQGSVIHVTASIGYAPMPLPPDGVALSWERAIGLVDMALYMAKVHGRNRAYGIRALRRSDAESIAMIERDLEKAWADGLVDMQSLPGPELAASRVADPAEAAAHAAA